MSTKGFKAKSKFKLQEEIRPPAEIFYVDNMHKPNAPEPIMFTKYRDYTDLMIPYRCRKTGDGFQEFEVIKFTCFKKSKHSKFLFFDVF